MLEQRVRLEGMVSQDLLYVFHGTKYKENSSRKVCCFRDPWVQSEDEVRPENLEKSDQRDRQDLQVSSSE